jgi:DUF1680 family protein
MQRNLISRRNFVGASVSAAAAGSLGLPRSLTEIWNRAASAEGEWRDEGVLFLDKSPYAKLRNIPVHAVTITNGFWSSRRVTNLKTSIPSMERLLEANGRMTNFLRLAKQSDAPQQGPVYSDSDVYKWLEAVGFALQSGDIPQLHAQADRIINEVVAVQEPNGYLNTYYVGDKAKDRMQPQIQRWGHELYNIGHMIQSGIAYYRGTGDTTMLDSGRRFVDDFLLPTFGSGPEKKAIFSGHPEIEMALIEMYRTTGNKNYLQLAGYILQGDDRIKVPKEAYVYHFCGKPFTSRTHLEGHAVRAMYACCGATDYYMETGDQAYWKTLLTLWEDLVGTQMYVTGGVGARSDGEAFGEAYELPNSTAYGESCAAIGNMMWNWRMLMATGEAKYADVIERALYNGINSGMSLDGTLYCYRNPLGFDPSTGDRIRNPWYDTTCCPPNLERTFASLPGYLYSTSKDGLYVHLYENSQLDWKLQDGTPLNVVQKTNYPWGDTVDIAVSPARALAFTLYVRVPGWSNGTQVTLNGKPLSGATPGQYLAVKREWKSGDLVGLKFDMKPQVIQANHRVVEDFGRVAVQRGPLVYCLEQMDQPEGVMLHDVSFDLRKSSGDQFREEFEKDLLGGVLLLKHPGAANTASAAAKGLYRRYSSEVSSTREIELKLIPYYAWANREETAMQVWTPVLRV